LKPDLEVAIRNSRLSKAKIPSVEKVNIEAVVAGVKDGPAAKLANA